ncbi:hypothetical protein ACHQM5_025949 [Ranunculus cassubicifolius]
MKEMRMIEEDRISNLHESLIHHILSFMDMKEVVHTSLISRRWRYLWTTLRTLNFDCIYWTNPRTLKMKRGKFKFFVESVLLLRDKSTDIDTFDLSLVDAYDNDFIRIDRWVACALRRGLRLLEFGCMNYPSDHAFPLYGRVNTLKLGGGFLPHCPDRKLLLELPLVENLTLDSVVCIAVYDLILSCPKLKHLEMNNHFEEFIPRTTVKICAPNLVSLMCKGYMYQDYFLEEFPSLVNAEINTRVRSKDTAVDPETLYLQCMSKILRGLTNAKSLTLSTFGLQCFEEVSNMSEWVPITYQNVKYLKLLDWLDCGDIHLVANLLKSFPHLETLTIGSIKGKRSVNEEEEGYEEEDWGAELSFECIFCDLKSIDIYNFEGTENEVMFIEFLLKGASVLENVNIMSTVASNDKEKKLVEFHKKIGLLQKASSRVIVSLDFKRKY